jgi:hypothetical protein
MNRADALPYVSYYLDDALAVRTAADMPATKVRLVGWQCGFEPLFVAVWSYLNTELTDSEAEDIAADYLEEIHWFTNGARTPADYVL